MNLRTPKTLRVAGASPKATPSKDALRRRSKPKGDALQRRFASQEQAQRRRPPKTLRVGEARLYAEASLFQGCLPAGSRNSHSFRNGSSHPGAPELNGLEFFTSQGEDPFPGGQTKFLINISGLRENASMRRSLVVSRLFARRFAKCHSFRNGSSHPGAPELNGLEFFTSQGEDPFPGGQTKFLINISGDCFPEIRFW